MKLVLNINDQVEVTLTKFGAEAGNLNAAKYKIRLASYVEGQVIRGPLWDLFNTFGAKCFIGFLPCFKDNEITVLEKGRS